MMKVEKKKAPLPPCDVGNDDGVLPAGTIVWKKARLYDNNALYDTVIVTLCVLSPGVVPASAQRKFSSIPKKNGKITERGFLRKCRVPRAIVVSIEDSRETRTGRKKKEARRHQKCASKRDSLFEYKVGKIVKPIFAFNSYLHTECTSGIHVFRTREEAEAW